MIKLAMCLFLSLHKPTVNDDIAEISPLISADSFNLNFGNLGKGKDKGI